MKNYFLLSFLFLFLSAPAWAQDTIVKRNGEEISAKVLKITPKEVEYKRFDNQDGPLFVILKSEVMAIRYQNGTKEIFDEPLPVADVPALPPIVRQSRLSNDELYMRGKQDAMLYYKGNGALWGTALPFILYPPAGLVSGAVIAVTPPKTNNFIASEAVLLKEPSYVAGYKKQAHKKKAGKVLAGVGVGVGFYTVVLLVLVAAFAGR